MSQLTSAFLLGLLSACSLPLGALTARFYKPGDRTIAFLMSFGGGALLAALTIDLAGPAVERGHFYFFASGCLLGGVLFVALNQAVNSHGGFLRKASTTIFYLRGQQRRRHKRFIERMRRLDILYCLGEQDLRELAGASQAHEFETGMTLFERRDPAKYLYVVEDGTIELLEPDNEARTETLDHNSAFGHMALFSGMPHATWAVAREDSTVLMIPRDALMRALSSSRKLRLAVADLLQSDGMMHYLTHEQKQPVDQARKTVAGGVRFVGGGQLPPVAKEFEAGSFGDRINEIGRFSFFSDLPSDEVHQLASRVFRKEYEKGHTFFYRGEPADRMFIVDAGEVALLDAGGMERSAIRVTAGEAFGALSFVTGARHAMTAVATSDASAWVLTRVDFEHLLEHCPAFAHATQRFVKREVIETYLHDKHHIESDRVASWISRAVKSMDLGKLIPHADRLEVSVKPQHGAPLAIWLGILLDGIPESLVIGSSMLHHGVSHSLIVGLFLSNYPEALSSSVGMRQQGIAFSRVLLMWTALMLITGVGAALGNLLFRETPAILFAFVQGIAAGAMLTMIAETMLPEAYFKGGGSVGFSTLLGFLAAIFTKTLG